MEALGAPAPSSVPKGRNPKWDAAIEKAMKEGNGRFVLSVVTEELKVVPSVLGRYISTNYPKYQKKRFRINGELKWGLVL